LLSKRALPLIPAGLVVDQVLPTPDHVTIFVRPRQEHSPCPTCACVSTRAHSRYQRKLGDLPWQGRPVTLHVRARRFRCLNAACERQTFAERLSGTARVAARRTDRLGDLQCHLGLALGGEAGRRLADRLAMPTSADTLLRLVCNSGTGADPPPTPRVLAIDDWAWRRGHRYGTILVNLERNEVTDLLPDRQAETLAGWLRQHPGIAVVARDRAGAYADGVRQGAPHAVQVADRWHLLRNLGDAVRSLVDRHHATIQRVARQISDQMTMLSASAPVVAPEDIKLTAADRRSQAAYARRQARYEEAARLRAAGTSIKRIAAVLGTERKTIRRWLRAGAAPRWWKPPQAGVLSPYREHLERRWAEGCRNAALLWRELVQRGFSGRPGTVRKWAGRRRVDEPRNSGQTSGSPSWQPPSVRQLARMLMDDTDALSEPEQTFMATLLVQAPALAVGVAVAKRLNQRLRRTSEESLNAILDDAAGTPLEAFAVSMRRDLAAVQAALDLPWTTSPAEGQINRLKMLKRTMYGRAGFPLLRARVLHAA
jgi:transposase